MVGYGRVVGVVAGVPSVCRQAWRGAGAFSACVRAVRRASGSRNGQPAAPRPLPAGAASAAARFVLREGSSGAGRSGAWHHVGGWPPAGWGGAVQSAVRGGNGAPAVPSQLWATAAPRWRRRAVSGGGGSRRRRRRPRAVFPRLRRRPAGAAVVAAVTDTVAGSSTARGRRPPQGPLGAAAAVYRHQVGSAAQAHTPHAAAPAPFC